MKALFFVVLFLFVSIGAVLSQQAEEITASEILRRVDEAQWSESSRSLMKKTIICARGRERSFTLRGYTANGNEKQLIRYIEPARVRGSSFLMLNEGDDIWFYTPRTGRVRKLASHMKRRRMMGSDFSHADMGGMNWQRDFSVTLIGEEREQDRICYKLKLIPTPEGPAYSKMFLWVDKESFIPLRVDYYDEEEKLLKRLLINKIEEIDGRMTPMRFTMENIQVGGKTVMEVIEIEFDIPVDDRMFTTGGLKR